MFDQNLVLNVSFFRTEGVQSRTGMYKFGEKKYFMIKSLEYIGRKMRI
jgi:hypothetical protein